MKKENVFTYLLISVFFIVIAFSIFLISKIRQITDYHFCNNDIPSNVSNFDNVNTTNNVDIRTESIIDTVDNNSNANIDVTLSNENGIDNDNDINNNILLQENDNEIVEIVESKEDITYDNVELICEPTYYDNIAIRNSKYKIKKEDLNKIQELVKNYSKKSSFFVFNIKDNMLMTYNATQNMFGASIVKLPYTYFCISEIEKENSNFSDLVRYEERFRHDGSGVLKNRKSGTDYTIKELLHYIIHYSDNTAYYMLFSHLDLNNFKTLMNEYGFKTNVYKNMPWDSTSAFTIGKFFQKIYYNYTNEIETRKNSENNNNDSNGINNCWEIYVEELKKSLDSPLKNNLGKKYKIASKSGWANLSYHEGGIVFADNPYIVVIFTKSNGEPEDQRYMSNLIHAIDEFIICYNKHE